MEFDSIWISKSGSVQSEITSVKRGVRTLCKKSTYKLLGEITCRWNCYYWRDLLLWRQPTHRGPDSVKECFSSRDENKIFMWFLFAWNNNSSSEAVKKFNWKKIFHKKKANWQKKIVVSCSHFSFDETDQVSYFSLLNQRTITLLSSCVEAYYHHSSWSHASRWRCSSANLLWLFPHFYYAHHHSELFTLMAI